MDFTKLLETLCAIERAIEDGNDLLAIQKMVIAAEDQVIQLQRGANDAQDEAALLRKCITNAQRSSLFRLSCPCVSGAEASHMQSPSEAPRAASSRKNNTPRSRFLN